MTHHVRLTARAEADLDRLLGGLAEVSRDSAARLAASFERALERLRSMPLTCGLAYESPHFAEEIRHLLFGISTRRRYRALFVMREDIVIVLAIRAPGERPVMRDELED